MAQVEPRYASDYDDRTTAAVKSVLVEIGQILGSYRGKFAVIGGAVPWLLLGEADMVHVGTTDVDLSLDAEALGDGEYAQLVETLMRQGYHQRDTARTGYLHVSDNCGERPTPFAIGRRFSRRTGCRRGRGCAGGGSGSG